MSTHSSNQPIAKEDRKQGEHMPTSTYNLPRKKRRDLVRCARAVALGCAVILPGACQSPFNGANDAWSEQTAHPITVQTKLVSEQFRVDPSDTQLSQETRDRVSALAADYGGRGVGKLTITSPQGSPNAASSVQIVAQMTQVAGDAGVRMNNVEITGYHATDAEPNPPVIVSYTVYDATASACGDWSSNYAFAPLNKPTPNHGCATQNNLAAMVENPNDLIAPRGEGGSDPARRATVLGKYRAGEPTAAISPPDSSGDVSEVAK
jgi:pilus assembly protein CpaD